MIVATDLSVITILIVARSLKWLVRRLTIKQARFVAGIA